MVTVKVNVETRVAGFIGLLNVALTMAVVEHTGEVASGVTEVTVGKANGSVGFPAAAFFSSPQPVIATANRNAEIVIFVIFDMCINFSSSFSGKAFHTSKFPAP